jgi:hypothetical protein
MKHHIPTDQDEYFSSPSYPSTRTPSPSPAPNFIAFSVYAIMFVMVGILVGTSVHSDTPMYAFAFVFAVLLLLCASNDGLGATTRLFGLSGRFSIFLKFGLKGDVRVGDKD